MMNVSSDILQAISQNSEYCHLVKLDLAPSPLYLTDSNFEIFHGLNIYKSSGLILDFGAMEFKSELTVGTIKLRLSAVDQSLISLFLNKNQVNRELSISIAYLDEGKVIDQALPIWSGALTGSVITEDDSAIIELNAASIWADFQKKSGRRTTEASQQKVFPTDKGMSFAAVTGREFKWGS